MYTNMPSVHSLSVLTVTILGVGMDIFWNCLHDGTLLFAVNIAPAAVRVPEAVTPQQAASGQTAILYPSAHSHALGQMVCISSSLLLFCPQLHS